MADKQIIVEFREKGRTPACSEFMPAEGAQKELGRVAQLLEESGTEGDSWIEVGSSVVIRAHEVHSIQLRDETASIDFDHTNWYRQS